MGLENPLHIAILLVILLLLFGAKRLPEMGRGLGSGIRSFKDGISGRGEPDADDSELANPAEPAAQPIAQPVPTLPAAEAPVAVPAADEARSTDTQPVGHPV
jgi:sec-independent protein translocase protein TatA